MKVFLIKAPYVNNLGEINFACTLSNWEQLETLNKILPGYQIIGEKELFNIPLMPEKEIINNYLTLFYSQPEIEKNKITLNPESEFIWYLYDNHIYDVFFDKKLIIDQYIDLFESKNKKEKYFKYFLGQISLIGGDNTGSLLIETLTDVNNLFYKAILTQKYYTEIDWRELYFNGTELLKQLCPDYETFLNIVNDSFGNINLMFDNDGDILDYYPEAEKSSSVDIANLKRIIDSKGLFQAKLKQICDILSDTKNEITIKDLMWLPKEFRDPIEKLGVERIRKLYYNHSNIENEILYLDSELIVKDKLIKSLKIGEKYSRQYIKGLIGNILNELKCPKSFPATHINQFFNTEPCQLSDGKGKRIHGYRIISIKD